MPMSQRAAAEAIRALRKANLTDEKIKEDFPEYAHGWPSADAPAGRARGSGSVAVPLTSHKSPFGS